MNIEQKLLVCEAMLARLDAAMTSAEVEVTQSSALEDHLRRLLANLEAEQARIDQNIRTAATTQDGAVAPPSAGARSKPRDIQNLLEQMARIRAVQNRLLLFLYSSDPAQQP
jgi:hypothetical protein